MRYINLKKYNFSTFSHVSSFEGDKLSVPGTLLNAIGIVFC